MERYVLAKAREEQKLTAYRFYVADMLQMIAENTARFVGKGGRYTKTSYRELIQPPKHEETDARKIVDTLTKKMGLIKNA